MLLVRVHGEYTYFPVPQTVQEVHSVSLVTVQADCMYDPAKQGGPQAVHTASLVELHTVLAYWPAPQTVQLVHTVLLLLVHTELV